MSDKTMAWLVGIAFILVAAFFAIFFLYHRK